MQWYNQKTSIFNSARYNKLLDNSLILSTFLLFKIENAITLKLPANNNNDNTYC